MMLVVRLKKESAKAKIEQAFQALERRLGLSLFWKKLSKIRCGEPRPKNADSYLVTAIGRDRTGIVANISRLLAVHRLNITDLNSEILRQGPGRVFAMALEVDIPKKFPLAKLEKALSLLGKRLRVETSLKPVERVEF